MITANEARELTSQASKYEQYLVYHKSIVEKSIKEAANEGKRDCIVDIENKYSYAVASMIYAILIGKGYSVRLFRKCKTYGLWIFW